MRVLRNTRSTLRLPVVGTPSAATVTIVSALDGTIVSAASATIASNLVSYTLAPRSKVDHLSVAWTVTLGGVSQIFYSTVEIVGAEVVSLDELRRLKPFDDAARFPDHLLAEARDQVLDSLEDAAGVRFAPTYFEARIDGSGSKDLFLPVARPRSIEFVSVSGETISDTEKAALLFTESGVLVSASSAWTSGRLNVIVKGSSGHDVPPARVGRAVALGVRRVLVESGVSDRATSITNSDGTSENLITSGVRGNLFDIPEMNAVLQTYTMKFGVA
jgi:hypothetical protein